MKIKQDTQTEREEWENQIKQLVENHRIIEARQQLSQANEKGIFSAILDNWQIVLKEPDVSIKKEATGLV